jgi:hypothetical protein
MTYTAFHAAASRSVPPMFAGDEPTSQGPRKDDVPTHDPRDYKNPAKGAPGAGDDASPAEKDAAR